jgi:hypothetical protein
VRLLMDIGVCEIDNEDVVPGEDDCPHEH